MVDTVDLQFWALTWLAVALLLIFRHWRSGHGVGLLLAYVVSFGALHWAATAMYLLPWYTHPDAPLVAIGMRLSGIAFIALAIGVEAGALVMRRFGGAHEELPDHEVVDPFAVNLYLAIGLLLQLVLFPLARGIPTINAIVGAGSMLTVVGIALKCWNAWVDGDRRAMAFWLTGSAFLPFFTVATQGFLGYGMASMMTILAFVAAVRGRSVRGVIAGLLVAYLGLSVYVTYMRDRADIRAVVWSGGGLNARVQSVIDTLQNPEVFNLNNPDHLQRIDQRLNQNYLVGAAAAYLDNAGIDFAHGATIVDAVLAVVPRALWPDKPVSVGSGHLVSTYTGLTFAEETSVGIGQVMEWYVNFGTLGITFGFFVVGAVLAVIDRRAQFWLRHGDVQHFAVWYLPGLALLQIGGSFVDVVSMGGAALAVTVGLNYLTRRHNQGLRPMGDDDGESLGAVSNPHE